MIGDVSLVQNLTSSPERFAIKINDGLVQKMTNRGSIVLSKNLTFNSILLAPNLNLQSFVSKST